MPAVLALLALHLVATTPAVRAVQLIDVVDSEASRTLTSGLREHRLAAGATVDVTTVDVADTDCSTVDDACAADIAAAFGGVDCYVVAGTSDGFVVFVVARDVEVGDEVGDEVRDEVGDEVAVRRVTVRESVAATAARLWPEPGPTVVEEAAVMETPAAASSSSSPPPKRAFRPAPKKTERPVSFGGTVVIGAGVVVAAVGVVALVAGALARLEPAVGEQPGPGLALLGGGGLGVVGGLVAVGVGQLLVEPADPGAPGTPSGVKPD